MYELILFPKQYNLGETHKKHSVTAETEPANKVYISCLEVLFVYWALFVFLEDVRLVLKKEQDL